jgi:hypothetical protein
MKKLFLSVFAALTFGAASANDHHHNFICSYYGEPINASNIAGFASSSEAQNVISNIIDVIGLQPKFQVRASNIPNAAAVVSSGQRYILYNPNFVASIDKAAGTKWASIAILAHEIGHHLNGHTLQGYGSRPSLELEADAFSGFILRKMGASLVDAQVAMKIAAEQKTSTTHPAKNDRLQSIANGWYKADGQITGKYTTVAKPVIKSQPSTTRKPVSVVVSPLAEKYVAYDVFFTADKNSRYYITTENNLVKIQGDQLVVIAKLVSTGKSAYPWMLYDGTKNYFLLDAKGNILTPQGKQSGYIRIHQKA